MKILLLGANGQVGWELCRTLAVLGEVVPGGFDAHFRQGGLQGVSVGAANLVGEGLMR